MTTKPKNSGARTGLDDFYDVWRHFNRLSALALTSAAGVPFAAFLAGIVPPWPDGIVFMTALVELVTIVLVFQFLRPAKRSTVNIFMGVTSVALTIVSTLYLVGFALFTYPIVAAKMRGVKGFICRADNPPITLSECPFVSLERLKDASYTAELIWTELTINLTRVGLATTWLLAFLLLSSVIGAFLVYQTKVPASARR